MARFLVFREFRGSRALVRQIIPGGVTIELPEVPATPNFAGIQLLLENLPQAIIYLRELFALSSEGKAWTAYAATKLEGYDARRINIVLQLQNLGLIVGGEVPGYEGRFIGPSPKLIKLWCGLPVE